MGIGMLALYAALAVVALWLIAELLLQNRAPLHWRALALLGFLAVVAGMGPRSVPVIGAGAAAFAAGQVLVTLSVKRGYRAGWSLRRPDGALPGALARVPLLSAATGGVPAAAVIEAEQRVGEVGPVEPTEPVFEPAFESAPEPAGEPVEYGIYETVESYQDPGPQLPQPQQAAYPYSEQQQYEYQQYGYYEQQQYVPYEQQWQQQGYDPAAQYPPEYGIPQQQHGYAYYQPQPEQPVQPQPVQPQPEQHWQGWAG
ncbi:hypothetical protein ACFW1A_37005 [Kitasatospora sp. NPDC058965]|uniref:hypothetical protein n=1 Tax=Kitasatospora sp. NPDC058965 TaxID=3346682 RepID=UPI00368BA2DA